MSELGDLRDTLINLKLTGELNRNTPEANRSAIREMLDRNDYWALEAHDRADRHLDYDAAAAIVAENLGMSVERFESDEPPFIDPDHTVSRLITGLHRLEAAARAGHKIMLSTAHPGSMLSFYQQIGSHLEDLGGRLIRLTEPVAAPSKRWLDDVGGVIVLSDEGNLMHTHASNGMMALVDLLDPAVVMSDHAFAIAAINAGVPTVAIFDVDDPAIPVAAHLEPKLVTAIPFNDNQTNTRTARAVPPLLKVLRQHARSL